MTAPQNRTPFIARLIFSSRWLQLPLYLGLIVTQIVYVVLFVSAKTVQDVVAVVQNAPPGDAVTV